MRTRVLSALLASALPCMAWAGGTLKVDSDVPGQTVLIDGEDLGLVTPAIVPAVPAGDHEVRVEGECRVAVTTVRLAEGAVLDLSLTTRELPGKVEFSVTPESGRVFVDGAEVPAGVVPLDCGSHSVRAEADGHVPIVASFELGPGEELSMPFALQVQGSALLTVDVDVESAFVMLDGELVGEGGVFERTLPAGPHQLEVDADGYRKYHRDLLIQDGEDLRVKVDMVPQDGRRIAPGLDLRRASGWTLTGAGASWGILAGVQLARMAQYGKRYQELGDAYLAAPEGGEPTYAQLDGYREGVLLPQRNRAVVSTVGSLLMLGGGVTLLVAF
jgi:hypothetical protein